MGTPSNKVLTNVDQTGIFSNEEKAQARANINAAENAVATQSSNGLMSASDKTKLDGIQAGAEANVQADWEQTDNTADDFIKNKPVLAAIALSGSWNDLRDIPLGLVIDTLYVHTDNNFTDALKSKLDGIEAGATKVLIPNNPSQPQPLTLDSYNLRFHWGDGLSCFTPTGGVPQLIVDPSITSKLAGIEAGAEVNVQADWSQSDSTKDDYIKNKPSNIVQDASYVHTDNNFTTALKDKLDGIAAGAEVNVQADWSQTDTSADDYIKNKPTINNVPAVNSGDNGKVLTASYSGGVGSYSWEDAQGLTFVVYDSTPFSTVKSLVGAGKAVFCVVNNSRMAFFAFETTNYIEFQYYRSATSGADSVFVYQVSSTGWTTTERPVEKTQSSWSVTNPTNPAYIKNKPENLVQDASYVHTDNNFTDTLKTKLDGIEDGAEVNDITDVQVNGVSVVTNKVANIVIPASATEVYLAEYGTATVADISAAKNAGKLVYTLIPGTYYPTVAYLRETTRNGASANFASPSSDSGSFKIASVDSSGNWSNETLNLAKTSDLSPNKVVFVTTSDTHATVNGYRQAGYDVILRYDSSGNDLHQYFRLSQYNPDGSMEFTCVRGGSGYMISYKYTLNVSDQWTRVDTSVSNYTGVQIDGVGRNLHLNQNNYVQTNFPGGLWDATMSQNNIFYRLGGFSGAFYLAARYKTDGTYELGLSYSGSGTYGTITFIGTETVIATDNTVTVKQAAYIAETEYYTVSTRFGGNASTPFDPTRHKAIYYSGFGNIGPASDVKIAIWNDNGTVKIGMTSIEVGKVGATN